VYNKAVKSVMSDIGKAIAALPEGAPQQMVSDTVFFTLYKNWGNEFSKPQQAIINKFVKNIYTFYRKDKSIFGGTDKKLPDSVFNQVDLRTLDYYKKSDSMYMGKFITDPDTKKKMTEYIKEAYLNNDTEIGKSASALKKFREEMGDILEGEDWKLQRIINTTVNKMRNIAAVNYMQEAEVEQFEIVGVPDSLQCGYCAGLRGKVFSVSKAVDTASSMVKSNPDMVAATSPFVTAKYKTPEAMAEASVEQLEAEGLGLPPFHANCRDTIVAIL